METKCLVHHGIEGQRWGIRRYQNKDGSLTDAGRERYLKNFANTDYVPNSKTKHSAGRKIESKDYTIKQGTELQRVSTKKEKDNSSRTYASYTNEDNKAYVAVAKDWMSANYKIKMKALSDVNVAGKKAQAKAFIDMLSDVSIDDLVNHTAPKITNKYGKETKYSKEQRKEVKKLYSKAFKNQETFDSALLRFHSALENNKINPNNLDNRFYKNLESQGYGALTDLNDLHFAEKPIIFINRKKSLKTTKISDLSWKETVDAQLWLEKHGFMLVE